MRDVIALGAVGLLVSGFVSIMAGLALRHGLWGFKERDQ